MDQELGLSAEMPQQTAPPPATFRRLLLRLLNALGVLLVLAAIFSFSLWLYARNNTFPLVYHPDEGGKVEQVMGEHRNYNHPLLMLEATAKWIELSPVPLDEQEYVVAGRQVSAFFGASAATMLALTAYLCAGWWALLLAGVLLSLCPSLLTYSHYMKEDASLVFGLAVVILASRLIWGAHCWWARIPAWLLLAVGCALATSGKYVGIMSLVMPLALFFIAPGFRWYRPILRILLFLPVFLFALGAINHRALTEDLSPQLLAHVATNPGQWESLLKPSFIAGLDRESKHATTEHAGLTAKQPNTFIIRRTILDAGPVVALLALALPVILLLTRRQEWGWEALMVVFTACCTLVLSCTVILFDRYALPVVVILHLLAALSIARILATAPGRPVARTTFGILSLAALTAVLAPTCLDYTYQFGHDSRAHLQQWALANLPKNTRVYADGYTGIGNGYGSAGLVRANRPDIAISAPFLLHTIGDLATFARYGECYVMICDLSYARYFDPSAIPFPGNEESTQHARQFYEILLQKHTPIWESVPQRNMNAFTNPVIKVYRIKPDGK